MKRECAAVRGEYFKLPKLLTIPDRSTPATKRTAEQASTSVHNPGGQKWGAHELVVGNLVCAGPVVCLALLGLIVLHARLVLHAGRSEGNILALNRACGSPRSYRQ